MTVSAQRRSGGYLERPAPSGLADVVEIILDKGIVIDAYVRVSLVGIELLTIDARIVIASVDTYLRFAEATNRLDLDDKGGRDLTEVIEDLGGPVVEKAASKVARSKVGGVVDDVAEGTGAKKVVSTVADTARKAASAVGDLVGGDDEDDDEIDDEDRDEDEDGDEVEDEPDDDEADDDEDEPDDDDDEDDEEHGTVDTVVDKTVELVTDLASGTVDRALDAVERVVGRAKDLLP